MLLSTLFPVLHYCDKLLLGQSQAFSPLLLKNLPPTPCTRYLLLIKHGKGVMNFNKGRVQRYNGEWKNDLFHGQGHSWEENSKEYFGLFERGLPQGSGLVIVPQGSTLCRFEGNFEAGKLLRGTLSMPNYRYEGPLDDFKPCGEGGVLSTPVQRYSDLKFDAHFRMSFAKCEFVWAGGPLIYTGKLDGQAFHSELAVMKTPFYEYLGSFNEGSKHGKGKIHFNYKVPSCYDFDPVLCYIGDFVNNRMSGSCKAKFRSGWVFEGTIKTPNLTRSFRPSTTGGVLIMGIQEFRLFFADEEFSEGSSIEQLPDSFIVNILDR